MDISNSSSYVVENNAKIHPLARRQPTSVGSSKLSSSQWTSVSSRSTSSPGAFFSNTLGSNSGQNNSEMPRPSEKLRVVSFPEYIYAPQRIQSEFDLHAKEGTSSDDYTSFSISSDSIEFTLNSELHTTAFPNIIVSNTTQNSKKNTTLSGDEGKFFLININRDKRNDIGFYLDWLTWTTSPPRPIPALHGPASLPYARCPSGAEGTVIEEPSLLPHVIWGLEPDDTVTFGLQYSQNGRKKYNTRYSNRRDSIYAIPDQNVKATQTEYKKDFIPEDFIYLSPPLFESPITYLDGVPNSKGDDAGTHGETLHPMDLTAQNHLVLNQNPYPLPTSGLGFGACNNSSSVELSHLNEQPCAINLNYLPTPPNSSSPQWNATFSPPTYSSFLIPLATHDTSDFQPMADYISTSGEAKIDKQRSEILDTQSRVRMTPKTAGKSNYKKRRGILKTVIEESPAQSQPLTCNNDDPFKDISTKDDELQLQSAQEYFASEVENQPVVNLPERVTSRRNQNPFKNLKLNPLYHTVHPSKLELTYWGKNRPSNQDDKS